MVKGQERRSEQGFMLLAVIVAVFLILLALSVAAPKVAQELRREREVEAQHRANQYVRAIRLFYLKNGSHYPGSLEQLEKTNNQRYLRQRYADPLTGKPDWRLIKVGEAKTTVKGFFGQPLAGVAPGLGSAAGMASGGAIGAGAAGASGATGSSSAFGNSSSGTSAFGGSSSGTSAFGGTSSGSSAFGGSSSGSQGQSAFGNPSSGTSGSGSSAFGSSSSGGTGSSGSGSGTGSSGVSSQSATSFTGGGAPFVGVGSVKPGDAILVVNEQTTYPTWEFLYDPRTEMMKAKVNLFGGGMSSTNATTLGSAQGMSSGTPGSPAGSFGNPTPGAGSSPGGTFGSPGSPTTPTQPAPTQPQ